MHCPVIHPSHTSSASRNPTPRGPETQPTPLALGLLVPRGSGPGAAGTGGAARRLYLSVLESSQSSALSSRH